MQIAAEATKGVEGVFEGLQFGDLQMRSGMLQGVLVLLWWHQEGDRTGLAHGRGLLNDPSDGADGAVGFDGAGGCDHLAARDVTWVQLIDEGQSERQPRRRAPA